MKVTTDACLFGAWVPVPDGAQRALDIGTGSGLLSLMLAQRFADLEIDAIEIDEDAATQAAENVSASRFRNRVSIIAADVRRYEPAMRYDFIFSNPPFFNNDLLSLNNHRNSARHGLNLSPMEFMKAVWGLSNEAATLALLLPKTESARWLKMLEQGGWYLHTALDVRSVGDAVTRCILVYGRLPVAETHFCELTVYDSERRLTAEAASLLQPFYLAL